MFSYWLFMDLLLQLGAERLLLHFFVLSQIACIDSNFLHHKTGTVVGPERWGPTSYFQQSWNAHQFRYFFAKRSSQSTAYLLNLA